MFLHHFITFFSGRSGPGPLGPVRKILEVRSGPEGPNFARSVGTLVPIFFLKDQVVFSVIRLSNGMFFSLDLNQLLNTKFQIIF
jgi:hypothetical protein